MKKVINITSPGTKWRVFEKECLEKQLGKVVDIALGDLEKTQQIATSGHQGSIVFWRLNSDDINRQELNMALKHREILRDFKMINDPVNHLHIHAKESAFSAWKEAGVKIPEFQVVESKEDITLKYPFLIRLNNQVTGRSSYLVRNEKDLDEAWPKLEFEYQSSVTKKPFTKKIAVQFIDASKEEGKYNLSYRVIVAGNKVVTGYARLSPASDWVAITGKFKASMGDLFIKYQQRCQNMIDKNHDKIVEAVQSIGMKLQGVDIIEDQQGQIYFLECQPGFSTGYSDWPKPFYNPHQRELVDFILKNEKEFIEKCPLYYHNWLDKEKLFNEIFTNLKQGEQQDV